MICHSEELVLAAASPQTVEYSILGGTENLFSVLRSNKKL